MVSDNFVPMCWKCSRVVTTKGAKSFSVIGCKDCEEIHSYSDAMELCPVLKEKRVKYV